MAFQNTVNRVNTYGIQGDTANGQVPHYSPTTARVGTSQTIYAGDFVWVKDANGVSSCYKAGTGKPTGIVLRSGIAPNYNIKSDASMQIPVGQVAQIVTLGDMFIKTTDSAAVGKKIFVHNTTGAITCGNAGASVSGATETDWTVVSLANNAAAAGGSVVIVSNVAPGYAAES